jgi:RHS repeat-associated protein
MRPLLGSLLTVALSLPSVASIPKERAADLVRDSAPAACNAFGLTPQAAARERRETARRELEVQEAMRRAQQLRSIAQRSLNPLMPAGATPPAVRVSAADLVRASATTGVTVTSAVISANEQLNARKYYFYVPEGHLISETETTTSTNPATEWEYIWFGDTPVAQIHTPTNEIAYYFTDHLGTPIIQTNQQGDLIWRAEYEPFGTIFAIRAGEGRYQPLRFPGMIADIGEPDVYYNMHRYYRSSWGRYTQADPLGRWGDEHPYLYAQGQPTGIIDPTGEKSRVCCTPIAGGALKTFNHCFIEMADEVTGKSSTFGLHRTSFGVGCAYGGTNPASFDKGSIGDPSTTCGDWVEGCAADTCVENVHGSYPKPSNYFYLGPNSNTYASHIASKCGLPAPPIADTWHTPGWGDPLPAKKPKAKCPPKW